MLCDAVECILCACEQPLANLDAHLGQICSHRHPSRKLECLGKMPGSHTDDISRGLGRDRVPIMTANLFDDPTYVAAVRC